MVEMSFGERFSSLIRIVLASPFFLAFLAVAILTVIILIINVKSKNTVVKILAALCYSILTALIFIKYGNSVITLSDTLVSKVFNAIYFPNLITYICMIIITVLLFIKTMLDKRNSKFIKYISIIALVIIVFLFVLMLDTFASVGVDFSDKTAIYTNESLLVLIQSTTGIFTLWCVFLVIDFIVSLIENRNSNKIKNQKLRQPEKIEFNEKSIEDRMKELEKIDFTQELTVLSEEGFHESFNKYKKKKEYDEYLKIVEKSK